MGIYTDGMNAALPVLKAEIAAAVGLTPAAVDTQIHAITDPIQLEVTDLGGAVAGLIAAFPAPAAPTT